MTITVFCILLFAALLHASWNAIVKASGDKMYAAISVSGSASLIALVMLPFAPQPTLASAPIWWCHVHYRWCIRYWWRRPIRCRI